MNKPFQSKINVRPGTGAYAGRWVIVNDETGGIVSDYASAELANKALPSIRKYARQRRDAMTLQDRPLRW